MSMFSQANFHCDSASAIFRCDQYEAAKATCASVTPGSFRTTYPSITRLQQHIAQKHFRSLSLSLGHEGRSSPPYIMPTQRVVGRKGSENRV